MFHLGYGKSPPVIYPIHEPPAATPQNLHLRIRVTIETNASAMDSLPTSSMSSTSSLVAIYEKLLSDSLRTSTIEDSSPASSITIRGKTNPPVSRRQRRKNARATAKAPFVYRPQQQTQQNLHRPAARAIPASAAVVKQRQQTNAPPGKAEKEMWRPRTIEERDRIKDFWLGLSEEERRNLVGIEKDTVLRRMKEKRGHSCNCAVCSRKRNAMEEELEALYGAYCEELILYANYQRCFVSCGGTIPPHPGPGPFPGSVGLDKNDIFVSHAAPPASEEDDKDEVKDAGDIQPKGKPFSPPKSTPLLTLTPDTGPRNILTVANSLFKDDDQDFFEMMEQLAERRMQRVKEASAEVEDNGEDENEDDIDMTDGDGDILGDGDEAEDMEVEDDEDEYEDDKNDQDKEDIQMTEEEQKNKRIFSIFASRMLEQRVMQASREKLAQERRLQLLRELEDEDKLTKEREAKRQSQNRKKKDKKRYRPSVSLSHHWILMY
ncbi:hypothetical protein AX14_006309 [Amanita brunnescens Koide BX004]|nr:hypothetical protein AX14_006309 [Amanita brunnescens Koide BX004]